MLEILEEQLIDGIAIFNAGWWSGMADADWPRAGLACLMRCRCRQKVWVMMVKMEMDDPFDGCFTIREHNPSNSNGGMTTAQLPSLREQEELGAGAA